MTNPCDIPCEKCGSTDITRTFYARGEAINNSDYNMPPCRWAVGQCYSYRAERNLIRHHCRCCQYDWVTKPLSKQRRQPLEAGDTKP